MPSKLSPHHGAMMLAGATALILGIGLVRRGSGIATYQELDRSRIALSTTVQKLEHQTKELRDEINRLTKSPSYAKKVLRDKYHVTDPNEDIVFFAE